MSKLTLKDIKFEIEDRYKRLKKGKRRPSLEYITVNDIREVFFPVAKDKEQFLKLSDEELRQLYEEWYENFKNKEGCKEEENTKDEIEGVKDEDKIFILPDLK